MSIDISSTVRSYPRLPYEKIKNDIIGSAYALSLVFVGPRRAQALNKKYRKKTYIPNVLSFELEKKSGEIVICPSVAKKEASLRDLTPKEYIGFLFIHALLHLKGHQHGDTMDTREEKYFRKYFR